MDDCAGSPRWQHADAGCRDISSCSPTCTVHTGSATARKTTLVFRMCVTSRLTRQYLTWFGPLSFRARQMDKTQSQVGLCGGLRSCWPFTLFLLASPNCLAEPHSPTRWNAPPPHRTVNDCQLSNQPFGKMHRSRLACPISPCRSGGFPVPILAFHTRLPMARLILHKMLRLENILIPLVSTFVVIHRPANFL